MNNNITYNKEKLIRDIASTPLTSIASGEVEINLNDYIIVEKIEIRRN